ncbi:acyl-CoA dehydrogenase domain-containing protein [Escherichia coli]
MNCCSNISVTSVATKVRSFWLGLTRGLTSSTPTGDATKRYYQHLNRLSANLALLSDVSMAVLGGSLKRRERISARLGDILSQLYLASAARSVMTTKAVMKPTCRWCTGRTRCAVSG